MIDSQEIRRRLPGDVRRRIGTHAGLWLDKYMGDQSRRQNGKGENNDKSESRRDLVDEVAELPEPPEYAACYKRWQEMLKVYDSAQTRRVQVRGRMAVGLGSESLLEASICLHHTYGVPYIPGSAIKGLAASYAHHYLGDEWHRGKTLHDLVFGKTDEAGYITFFDALYIPGTGRNDGRALAPDVITVHHQEYYQGAGAPTDSDDPNPIPFLSATGQYLLALAAPDFQQPTRWVDITFQILAEALEKLGIGAKTSSGYGRMKFIDSPVRPPDPEVKAAENYKREVQALKNVAGEINAYYQRWQNLTSEEARKILAQSIVDKIESAGRTKATADRTWYKELRTFLDSH